MSKFINIIYGDAAHSEHMVDRLEGVLLDPGIHSINRCKRELRQVGVDEVSTRGQEITEVTRRFEIVRTSAWDQVNAAMAEYNSTD